MTAEVILYTGRKYASGEHPIMLKLTHRQQRKYKTIATGFTAKKSEWNFKKRTLKTVKNDSPGYTRYLEMTSKIDEVKSNYSNEIKILASRKQEVSIDGLIKRVENPVEYISVFGYFDRVIQQEGGGKYGHSKTFNTCLQRLQEFASSPGYSYNPDPNFYDINLRWLNDFRDLLRNKGLKDTTISIYFRSLRDVFNRAIGEEYCDAKDYPFGRKKDKKKFAVSQFKTETAKRAISQKDIQKIKNLDLTDQDTIARKDKNGKAIRPLYQEDMEDTRTIFLFSYYAVGMNFHDIARLRWSDIKDGLITYTRQKTGKRMTVSVHKYNKVILSVQEMITGDDLDNYVFNILHKATETTEAKIYGRIHRQMRLVNDSLKEIQRMTGIRIPLTTYVARHSAITHMIRNGVRLDIVQENAGHSDLKTTMIYKKQASQKEKATAINSLS